MQQIQRELQTDGFHVGALQRARNVHVHVQEPLHGSPKLGLFDFELRQEVDEPFERALRAVDPEEVDLFQIHHRRGNVAGPLVQALRAAVARFPVTDHDGLQDACERGDADSSRYEHGVLRLEYVG